MREIQTDYGKVFVLDREAIFQKTVEIMKEICLKTPGDVTVGLTGGSTPKEFYKWAVKSDVFKNDSLNGIIWMATDERYLPLESDESNFGNADRLMLKPLRISKEMKRPWKVNLSPIKAAEDYNSYFAGEHCFNLCILGMGDDCHMASIFPGSPLINEDPSENFVAIEVPKKGMRLTITPNGIRRSYRILMVVTGMAKSHALKQVLEDNFDPKNKPAQLNRNWGKKVIWLVDHEAASELSL